MGKAASARPAQTSAMLARAYYLHQPQPETPAVVPPIFQGGMTEDNGESPAARRLRRLRELGRTSQMPQVNAAVSQVWQQYGSPRPQEIWLRPGFLLAPGDESGQRAGPMSRLISSRGVALRFYLLAVFDALCRQPSNEPWRNTRPVSGRMGWEDPPLGDEHAMLRYKAALSQWCQARDIPSTDHDGDQGGA